jgi:hypothetical protein
VGVRLDWKIPYRIFLQNPALTGLVVARARILKIDMPTRQERRDSERVPCKLVCPFELTKLVNKSTVKLTKGFGHAINKSVRGMLLLLPEQVKKRQVVEIRLPSKAKKKQNTKLVEVCWTRAIPVSARVKMYLAGSCFLFELPVPSSS